MLHTIISSHRTPPIRVSNSIHRTIYPRLRKSRDILQIERNMIITSSPLPPQNCCHHCGDHYIFTSTSTKLLPPLWRSLYLHLYLHKTVATIVTIIISSPLPPQNCWTIVTIIISSPLPPQNCCHHCDDHYIFTSTSTKLLPPLWQSLYLHLYLHKTVATIVTNGV